MGMNVRLSQSERRVLLGLQKEAAGDAILKLDCDGFILKGSSNLRIANEDIASMLFPPRLCDLAQADYQAELRRYMAETLRGNCFGDWFEFPLAFSQARAPSFAETDSKWQAVKLRRIANDDGKTCGALGLLRSVDRVRNLEDRLASSVSTDPLTGLMNRQTFFANLRRELAAGTDNTLVLISVDRMRSLLLQYGQRTADEVLWGFANFLETMAEPAYDLAQLDGERFAVLLRSVPMEQAKLWAQEVLETFASLALSACGKTPKLSMSVGLARVESTVDWTLRQAEIALVMARAGGGMQLAHCKPNSAQHPVSFAPTIRTAIPAKLRQQFDVGAPH